MARARWPATTPRAAPEGEAVRPPRANPARLGGVERK